jgi:hypothetical protein
MTNAIFNNDAIAAAIAAAAAVAPDMKESTKGGGTFVPPAAGGCLVTLVGYVELGIQQVPASKFDPIKFPGGPEEQVQLTFELHGKGREPKEVGESKTLVPERISVTLKKSLNEKAWFYKIFNTMNYDKQATHFAQLLGKHFRAVVIHSVPKKAGDPVYAGFKDSNGFTFAPPTYNPVDPDTQIPDMSITKLFPKPNAITPLKLFLWDFPSKPMWDSLYIEGKYEDRKDDKSGVVTPGRSKNVFQEKIRGANNFKGSPVAELLVGDIDVGGLVADVVPEAASVAEPSADAEAAALAML